MRQTQRTTSGHFMEKTTQRCSCPREGAVDDVLGRQRVRVQRLLDHPHERGLAPTPGRLDADRERRHRPRVRHETSDRVRVGPKTE
jgi:hypothetical protein